AVVRGAAPAAVPRLDRGSTRSLAAARARARRLVTVVLYYHQLGTEPSPLAVSPALFSEHLAVVAESGLRVVTAAELADAVREGSDVSDLVAITFDDGFAAAEMRATFFCVAGHLGGRSDWPSRLPDAPVEPLATADDLRTLAAGGHE